MAKLNEEMKRFISSKFIDEKKTGKNIIKEFGEKYGFLPSAAIINKYLYFNEINPPVEEIPDEEDDEKGEEGKISISTKDTRLHKELVDFSSGEIDDADFERLCRSVEKSKNEVWKLLAEALRRGYTKVDIDSGDLSE